MCIYIYIYIYILYIYIHIYIYLEEDDGIPFHRLEDSLHDISGEPRANPSLSTSNLALRW